MKAYSYVRFSTAIQAQGDSLRRQVEATKKYCEENGLILDESLTLHDLGVSAFKGANAAEGKLGAFIQAVDEGKVEVGSTLLVESLDRITREDVINALSKFTAILDKGITVVTLSDKRVYTREAINDIGNLMFSLIIMARAHEESQIKSQRIKAAWDNKKKLAIDEKKPKTKMAPSWLALIDNKYVLKEEESTAVKKIFELYEQGYGYALICKYMNQHYKPINFFGRAAKQWHQAYIVRLLNNRAVIGEHDGINDYFPKLINEVTWAKVQMLRNSKLNKTGGRKATVINIFSHICRCGYCGGAMIRLNKSSAAKKKKEITMVCNNGRIGITECSAKGWKMDELEIELLRNITELDVDTVLGTEQEKNYVKALSDSIIKMEYELTQMEENETKLVEAILLSPNLEAVIKKLEEVTKQKKELIIKIDALKVQYGIDKSRYDVAKSAQQKVGSLIKNLENNETRMIVNTEIKKIVSKIILFNKENTFVIEYANSKRKEKLETGRIYTISEEKQADGFTYRIHSIP